jgi:hypothetical protein
MSVRTLEREDGRCYVFFRTEPGELFLFGAFISHLLQFHCSLPTTVSSIAYMSFWTESATDSFFYLLRLPIYE